MSLSDTHYLWYLIPALIILGVATYFTLTDRPKVWKWASLVSAALAITLLVLALCRPYLKTDTDHLHATFLIDGSASISLDAFESAIADIETSIENLDSSDTHTIILFADNSKKTTIPELKTYLEQCRQHGGDANFRAASHLKQALLTARLNFPADKAKRLIVYTDAIPTGTDPTPDITALKNEGIDLHLNQIDSLNQREAAITAFHPLTSTAFQGEIVRMRANIAASQNMAATVRLLHRGVQIQQSKINLKKGNSNPIDLDVEMTSSGAATWSLEIIPEKDHFPANNTTTTTVQVAGKPRILAIHSDTKKLRAITRALRKQDIEIDVRGGHGLPQTLQELLAYKAIILADVPATDLTMAQMENLKRYVGDFGGGLAMLGSENSFGIGGYYGTPVDEILPLTSRYEKEKQKPSLAMVLVIDKSGSMSGAPIELARQASKSAVDLLGAQDSIAVVGFDSEARVIVPMTSAAAKATIIDSIDTLAADGGTNLQPAMQQAKEMLESSPAKIKHMIILSDGQTGGGEYLTMARDMAAQRMTISTVALGDGAAKDLMTSIAAEGKGRYYETNDPSNMPQIFTKETMQASKSAIKEDIYAAQFIGDHPLANGFRKTELPLVMGYVMTKPRPTANVIIAAETGDPLLAISPYGLGTTLAYASDLTEKWGSEWLGWSGCAKFWSQALRAILRKEDGTGIHLKSIPTQDQWLINVTRRDQAGNLINKADWNTNALNQDGQSIPFTLQQTGIGTYSASIPLTGHQKIALQIQDTADGNSKTIYWERPYPAEYQLGNTPHNALALATPLAPSAIRKDIPKGAIDQESQHYLIFAAIAFLIASVLFRRLN